VLEVPSAIVPSEMNYLLNPAQPDFRRIRVRRPLPFLFDPRIWKWRRLAQRSRRPACAANLACRDDRVR
jgi:hypothetical protein